MVNKYSTGKPCINGHISERYVSNNFCIKCSVTYRNRYKNKNPQKIKDNIKNWKKKNKKRHSELNKKSRLKNILHCQAKCREYAKKNKDVNLRAKHKRRSKLNNAGGYYTKEDIVRIAYLQKNKCAGCSVDVSIKKHIDHIIPIAKGGTSWPRNIQLLCPQCNHSKHAKDPIDWARERGMLL